MNNPLINNMYNIIFFIAPIHDDITKIISNWLAEIIDIIEKDNKCDKIIKFKLIGEHAATDKFLSELENIANNRVLIIFFGHGINEGFITAMNLGKYNLEDSSGWRGSMLCTADDFIYFHNLSIIAYCCRSANKFGKYIRSISRSNKMIGFTGKLTLCLGNEERENSFKRPITLIAKKAICDGSISNESLNELKYLYEEEIKRWKGLLDKDEKAHWVRMCLIRHIKILDPIV